MTLQLVPLSEIKITCPEHGEQSPIEKHFTSVTLPCGAVYNFCGPYGWQLDKHLEKQVIKPGPSETK